ncbi:MAG TPA: M15 family metallopeptidase [Kofleriaceae bacterium]|nr:M15 family metallopeptidase [Kofleriaceae bacterium]
MWSAPEVDVQAPIVAVDEVATDPAVEDTWTLGAESIERIGYRFGHRHVVEVVRLGPLAIEVEIRTARAFLAMRAAAADAGVELGLASGFRTAEEQRELYRAWRKGVGNKAARPGRSNHQSGRALDIAGVGAPGALAWLEANAASFGFTRTVKNEPWHWEYVDIPIARPVVARIKRTKVGHPMRPAKRSNAIATTRQSSSKRVAASSQPDGHASKRNRRMPTNMNSAAKP